MSEQTNGQCIEKEIKQIIPIISRFIEDYNNKIEKDLFDSIRTDMYYSPDELNQFINENLEYKRSTFPNYNWLTNYICNKLGYFDIAEKFPFSIEQNSEFYNLLKYELDRYYNNQDHSFNNHKRKLPINF